MEEIATGFLCHETWFKIKLDSVYYPTQKLLLLFLSIFSTNVKNNDIKRVSRQKQNEQNWTLLKDDNFYTLNIDFSLHDLFTYQLKKIFYSNWMVLSLPSLLCYYSKTKRSWNDNTDGAPKRIRKDRTQEFKNQYKLLKKNSLALSLPDKTNIIYWTVICHFWLQSAKMS